jgi:glyoxylase-like metal-dependent hydrolase (beta-lactamase superfamily II)
MLPGATELAPGLHRWVAFHPEWKKEVACAVFAPDGTLVLIDPLAPGTLREARAFWKGLDRMVEARGHIDVVLTLHYHVRSAAAVLDRYGAQATLWAPAGSSSRLRLHVDRELEAGDSLPGAIEALASGRRDELVLWVPAARALVTGDVLLGGVRRPYRVCPPSWLPTGVARAEVAAALLPLCDLDVDVLLPLHGPPVTSGARDAIASAVHDALAGG